MLKFDRNSLPLVGVALIFAGILSNKLETTLLGDDTPAATPESLQFFKEKVRPILTQNCYPCHTDTAMGQLRIDSREGILKGGSRGPAIVPGDPEKSLLIEAVRQTGMLKMPMKGRVTEQQVADLAAWIKMGAPWDPAEHAEPIVPAVSAAAASSSVGGEYFETKVRPIFANA